ncbi:MAG: polyamine ABC transporter substrate-binding protein [Ilumatobacteraceae bacterium]
MSTREPVRILADHATAQRIVGAMSRRQLFAAVGGSAALAAFLAACGGSGADGVSGGENSFKLFTWAEYDDPDLMASFGNIEITIFNSNEEAIQKLVAAGGNNGFDMICPTGVYIPQLVGEDLLEELDLAKIPNFKNLDAAYTNQEWDQGNKHSVCKNWGSTGWIYDKTVITREIKTWADFIDVASNEASGQTSILDTAPNLCGMYFWANGKDWTTTDEADLKACEDFLVNEFAQHVKAFDSYPGINLTQGNYALSMVWNGDARQGLLSVEESGGNPDDYVWGLGAPETELWMDNWCILKGAANQAACYNFINFILDPANSAKDIQFHGYNTGIQAAKDALPADTKYVEMIYFTDEEVSRMKSGSLANQQAVVDIYNKVKAAAGA